MKFNAVKGTRDFYPESMEQRTKFFNQLRMTAVKYGYKEVETPAMESTKLLTAKSGEEIKDQIFVMEKRSSEEIALRFDLTVPLTRMFIEKQKEMPKPVKWFYLTRMWRYEAPQKGRLREFYQFGIECFGSDKVEADAEVISLAIDSLVSLGLSSKDIVIKINNRDLLQGYLESIGVKNFEKTLKIIDKKAKITEKEFNEELNYLTKDQIAKLQSFLKINDINKLPLLKNQADEAKNRLIKLFSLLDKLGKKDYIQFAPEIARGLGYYTGTVFECYDRKQSLRAILGGGRYDKMIEQFGGQPCSATGFAMGDVVLEIYLKEKGLLKESRQSVDYYLAPVNSDYINTAMEIAAKLRKNNSVDIDLMGRKLGKQFSYADSINAKKVIVVGDETKSGKVKVKDMVSGKETDVKIDTL